MPDELTLGIIGVGNMGGALAQGALEAGAVSRVVAMDVSPVRLEELEARIGPRFVQAGAARTAQEADLLIVAVKPWNLPLVLEEVGGAMRPGCPLVSVAAGVTLASIEAGLPGPWPVVRAMPNLALLVRESATALCANVHVGSEQQRLVETVFEAVGTIVYVVESQMHAVTGLSGSGPAYVSLLIEGLAAGAVSKGLEPAVARDLACQLFYGTAKLLREERVHPATLSERVTTPGGTTIAGLRELELGAVRGMLMSAVEAASERSEELGELGGD